MPWLDYGGRLRKLPDGAVVIGSGDEATVRIDDLDLMPRHVVVEPAGDHVTVRAWSPDVVVAVGAHQIGTESCEVAYGEPIRAGSGELRIWRDQPASVDSPGAPLPRGYLIDVQEQVAYPLDRLSTNIGRARGNIILLSDPTASRFHAQIRREAGGFALHVVGSAGGAVNGRRVSAPILLEDGDTVELAYAAFRFTRGPVPEGIRVVPVAEPGPVDRGDRPTIVHDRISLQTPVPGAAPRIVPTAIVIGGLLLAGIAAWLLLG